MKQRSTKVWVLKSDPSQHWFSPKDALAEGHKAKDLERFDSLTEFARFKDLLILQDVGEIRDLKCHPSFKLSDRFNRVYSPDFTYYRLEPDFHYHKAPFTEWLWANVKFIQEGNKTWVLVAEDVKGVKREKTARGYKESHLLRNEHPHIFERFMERYPQYHFELYPPLD